MHQFAYVHNTARHDTFADDIEPLTGLKRATNGGEAQLLRVDGELLPRERPPITELRCVSV